MSCITPWGFRQLLICQHLLSNLADSLSESQIEAVSLRIPHFRIVNSDLLCKLTLPSILPERSPVRIRKYEFQLHVHGMAFDWSGEEHDQ